MWLDRSPRGNSAVLPHPWQNGWAAPNGGGLSPRYSPQGDLPSSPNAEFAPYGSPIPSGISNGFKRTDASDSASSDTVTMMRMHRTLEARVTDLEGELARLKREHASDVESLRRTNEASFDALRKSHDGLHQLHTYGRAELDGLRQDHNASKSDVVAVVKGHARLQQQQSVLESRFSSLEEKVAVTKRLSSLEDQLGSLNGILNQVANSAGTYGSPTLPASSGYNLAVRDVLQPSVEQRFSPDGRPSLAPPVTSRPDSIVSRPPLEQTANAVGERISNGDAVMGKSSPRMDVPILGDMTPHTEAVLSRSRPEDPKGGFVPSVRKSRKPEHEKVPKAVRVEPRTLDWGDADSQKWKTTTQAFNGQYSFHDQPEIEKVQEPISKGLQKLKDFPEKFEGLFYQADMTSWPAEQQRYRLVKRTGSGFCVNPEKDGPFIWCHMVYEALKPDVRVQADKFTDRVLAQFEGQKLGTPFCPGRGSGIDDVPGISIILEVDPSDVTQGSVGDCWLLSAISALAEYSGAIMTLFRKTKDLNKRPYSEQSNFYTVTLFSLPEWQPVDVVVDERLCAKVSEKGLLGCAPAVNGELWACYLEKAVAAICGGWDKIDGGTPVHAWRLLTGCKDQYTISVSGKVNGEEVFSCYGARDEKLSNSPHDCSNRCWQVAWPEVGGGGAATLTLTKHDLFDRLCAWEDSNYILSAGTQAGSDTKDHDGVVDGHAYSILACICNAGGTDIDMIKVRNPWGKGELTSGPWTDDGTGWDMYPQVKKVCNPAKADDGIFWMDRDEFFKYFRTIYLCAHDMKHFIEIIS